MSAYYIRCAQHQLPLSTGGDNFQSETLKTRDTEENECLEGLKSSCDRYLPGGLSMFLVKQDFAIFSNVMFSFGSIKSLE